MLAVLRRRDFGLLWTAGLVSLTGDWMLAVALPIAVYALTGSALATGGVLVANKLAALLLGSLAGVFVDRWDRTRTMVVADLARALLLVPLFAVDSADRVWVVYVVAAALSAVGQFFRPAESALLPRLVGDGDLVPANALTALNADLAVLIGPALGGLVAAWRGLDGVVAIDAASFLIAAGMIAVIAAPTQPARAHQPDAELTGAWAALWREWQVGLRLVWGSPLLRIVFGVFAIASLGEGVMQTAFWVWVDHALDGGPRAAGWLLSAQAVGGLVGAAFVGGWGRGRSPLTLLGWGAIGVGLIDLLVFNYPAVVPGIGLGLSLMVADGLAATAFGTGYTTALQAATADAYRGRVFGALGATSALFMIGGAAFAGVATGRFGAVAVLSLDALGYAAAGACALTALRAGAATWGKRHGPRAP